MDATLETLVAQAVYAAKRFERAVHDPGPWTMTYGTQMIPVDRSFTSNGVVFYATFPEVCHLREPGRIISLECAGDVVAVRTITHPGDVGFDIEWVIEGQRVGSHV